MFYLTHFPDHDVRRISWSIINGTVSIFCAVTLYSSVTQLVEALCVGKMSLEGAIQVNRVYVVFWYLCLSGGIFWCAGLGQGAEEREKLLAERQHTQNNMRLCMFFAHTTGFAGIAGWAMKQNTAWYGESPWHSARLLPEAVLYYYVIIKALRLGRRWISHHAWIEGCTSSKMDELIETGEDQLQDGENDFFGLFMSFLMSSTLRYAVSGQVPEPEGAQEGESKFYHSLLEVFWMYLFAVLLFATAYGLLRARKSLGESDEAKQSAYRNIAKRLWWCLDGSTWWSQMIHEEAAHAVERTFEVAVNVITMSFAWCFMFATQWLLARWFEGEDTVLGIVLALALSLCSALFVWVLDNIADTNEARSELESYAGSVQHALDHHAADLSDEDRARLRKAAKRARSFLKEGAAAEEAAYEKERAELDKDMKATKAIMARVHSQAPQRFHGEDEVLRKLMESVGILVGFAWEQSFDFALEDLASGAGPWLKPLLGLLAVLFIVPAWRRYIVPMETEHGYLLGFWPNKARRRLEEIEASGAKARTLKIVREQFEEAAEELLKRDPEFGEALRKLLARGSYEPPVGLVDEGAAGNEAGLLEPRG